VHIPPIPTPDSTPDPTPVQLPTQLLTRVFSQLQSDFTESYLQPTDGQRRSRRHQAHHTHYRIPVHIDFSTGIPQSPNRRKWRSPAYVVPRHLRLYLAGKSFRILMAITAKWDAKLLQLPPSRSSPPGLQTSRSITCFCARTMPVPDASAGLFLVTRPTPRLAQLPSR
jgi:hypothetical protein